LDGKDLSGLNRTLLPAPNNQAVTDLLSAGIQSYSGTNNEQEEKVF
jgi:hypothetical protein